MALPSPSPPVNMEIMSTMSTEIVCSWTALSPCFSSLPAASEACRKASISSSIFASVRPSLPAWMRSSSMMSAIERSLSLKSAVAVSMQLAS